MQEWEDRSLGEEDERDEEVDELAPSPLRGLTRGRAVATLAVLLVLVLMAVIPPLINVGRYRREIATSIGASLGRPVHIESVSLNVLPMPGFTLENFVVDEDPAFGAEPVIRANEVRATLRLNSLWRRRVEFSRISLDEPSVNLVHLANGQWNLESILLQASRMPAAPTEQKRAGSAPRFPYIEATGARVNVKMGLEKMPLSLTEAEFALWLAEPGQWHLRLKAHLARTDEAAMDTGTFRMEGTLGHAATLAALPVDLSAEWGAAPLGGVTSVLTGGDMGLRGDMTVSASVHGTMGENRIQSALSLSEVRRADFVPQHTLDAQVSCAARARGLFHALEDLRCAWPAGTNGGLLLTGDLPDLLRPGSAQLQARLANVPVSGLLDALRAASERVSPRLAAGGALSGTFTCCEEASEPAQVETARGGASASSGLQASGLEASGLEASGVQASGVQARGPLSGSFTVSNLQLGLDAHPPFVQTDAAGEITGSQLVFGPLPLELGGKQPASLSLAASRSGLRMTLTGPVAPERLASLADALPVLGDGIDQALPAAGSTSAGPAGIEQVALVREQPWGGKAVWAAAPPAQAPPQHPRRGGKRSRRRR